MVVKKAIKMARMMHVPILGFIENMSGFACPHCGKPVELFGPSKAENVAAATGLRLLGRLPLDPELSRLGDAGEIEQYQRILAASWFTGMPDKHRSNRRWSGN